MRPATLAVLAFVTACASAGPADPAHQDAGDLSFAADLTAAPDLACSLGTPDHCGSCATSCPGIDNSGTQRSCSAPTALGACDIICKGEFYDVDADATNGCELEDPAHSSAATAKAVTLSNSAVVGGACTSANNGCSVTEPIASDARKHDTVPTDRPLGREDWWTVTAIGAGGSNPMKACLSISNATWPSDNQYELCISAVGSLSPTSCTTAIARMASVCVQPPGNTDAGTYTLRVRKLAGAPTSLGYALYLEH